MGATHESRVVHNHCPFGCIFYGPISLALHNTANTSIIMNSYRFYWSSIRFQNKHTARVHWVDDNNAKSVSSFTIDWIRRKKRDVYAMHVGACVCVMDLFIIEIHPKTKHRVMVILTKRTETVGFGKRVLWCWLKCNWWKCCVSVSLKNEKPLR